MFFGSGEGTGEWAAHNAFLIVLQEDGLWASLLLVALSALLIRHGLRVRRLVRRVDSQDARRLAAVPFVLGAIWVPMIFFNWAQLNQSLGWAFIALALCPTALMRPMTRSGGLKRAAIREPGQAGVTSRLATSG